MATVTERSSLDELERGRPLWERGEGDDPPITSNGDGSGTAGPMTQRRVLGLALPIIGENLLQTMVGTVDTLMVSQLGKAAVAGVGTSIEVVFFIISALSAVSIGATVLISQAFGAGDRARANRLAVATETPTRSASSFTGSVAARSG